MESNVVFANRIAAKMDAACYLPNYAKWLAREVGTRKAMQHWRLAFNLIIAQTIGEVEALTQHRTEHQHDKHERISGLAADTKS